MLPADEIRTSHIVLRRAREEDVPDFVAACNDPSIQRFVPVPRPYTEADALAWVRDVSPANWAAGGAEFVIADPVTDRLLGHLGLRVLSAYASTGEIGYWLAPWARGKGFTAEAIGAVTELAFRHGFARLEIAAEVTNPASHRVALAAGFRREGVRRGDWPLADGGRADSAVFTRLPDDPAGPIPRVLPDLPGGELTDGVVTLRPLGPADLDDLLALHREPDVYLTRLPPVEPGRAEIAHRCAISESRWLADERVEVTIREATTGAFAGDLQLAEVVPAPLSSGMVGYATAPAFRGRGFTARAVRLLSRWALERAGLARVWAGTLPDNLGSQRVLERAGFVREGVLRGEMPGVDGERLDDVIYGLIPGDLTADPK